MKKHKIIFLDIDGVLNSARYDAERTPTDGNIDKTRLSLLKYVIDRTDADIVLSSSWRKHWNSDFRHCDAVGKDLQRTFTEAGLTIFDKTPVLSEGRTAEIRQWLAEHDGEVDAFAILDDTLGGWEELSEHLVRTNYRIGRGLEEKHLPQLLRTLKVSPDAPSECVR